MRSQVRVTLTVIAAIVTICLFTVRGEIPARWSADPQVAPRFLQVPRATHATSRGAVDGGDAEGAFDLYGNEVNDAVATFKLDAGGSLYEVHSPQTGLPHLGSPTG